MSPLRQRPMFETFGRYQLLKRVAKGGMGEVFLARQQGVQGFEKLLIVKKVLAHHNEEDEFIKMFLDEARITASLNHPNIAQIFDLGEQDGIYYLAMEYVRGDDVRRIWKRCHEKRMRVPAGIVARIIADAAAGLDFAHKAVDSSGRPLTLIHRDVSPQNVLVSFEGGVKLIDFGVAKAAGRMQHTASGVLKGKYAYMSPEQAAGSDMDFRSDIFALGIVWYELLIDGRLFKRDSDTQTLKAVTDCVVVPPTSIVDTLPKSLETLVLKALARDPAQRFRDAQAMRLAIEEWIVESRSPGSAAHLAQFMQELYADRIAEERQLGHPTWEEIPRATGSESKGLTSRERAGASRVAEGTAAAGWKRVLGFSTAIGVLIGAIIAVLIVFFLRPPPSIVWVELDPPNASIYRDNELIGQGRVRLQGEPGSSVSLSFRAEGYEPMDRKVGFHKEPELTLKIALAPLARAAPSLKVHVDSKPSGAEIHVGAAVACSTPCDVSIPAGATTTEIVLMKDGFLPATHLIVGETPGGVTIELTPKPKPKNPKPHSNTSDIQLSR
jgi:serine/threonine protein kinase